MLPKGPVERFIDTSTTDNFYYKAMSEIVKKNQALHQSSRKTAEFLELSELVRVTITYYLNKCFSFFLSICVKSAETLVGQTCMTKIFSADI